MDKKRILVADDEESIISGVRAVFEMVGYEVIVARDGRTAWDLIKEYRPQLVILDYIMPEMNGMEVCKLIRNDETLKNCYVIILTAHDSELLMAAGFDSGADDYLCKPVSLALLAMRVKAALNRYNAPLENVVLDEDEMLAMDGVEIDAKNRSVKISACEVNFQPKEYELFMLLISNPNRVLRREEIMEEIWQGNAVTHRAVDTAMRRMRRKLEIAPLINERFKTVNRIGYMYELGK